MKIAIVIICAVLLLGFAQAVVAEKPEGKAAALERKLHGAWKGNGPCDGGLIFRADGSYERSRHGPGGNNSAGAWEVRWDALPPTLILTCKQSDDAAYLRKDEVKLIQLDDQDLTFKYPSGQTTPVRYSRVTK